jgi:hypothetical protein
VPNLSASLEPLDNRVIDGFDARIARALDLERSVARCNCRRQRENRERRQDRENADNSQRAGENATRELH